MTRVKVDKPKAKLWYQDAVQNANLPTSKISFEALQAGLDFDVTGMKSEKPQKSSPARRRRGDKLAFNPFEGIPVSDEAAEVFIANGAPDRRMDPVPAFSSAANSSTSSLAGVPAAVNGLSSYSSPYPSPSGPANYAFSRNVTALEKNPFLNFPTNIPIRASRKQAKSVAILRTITTMEITAAEPPPASPPPLDPPRASESRFKQRMPTNAPGSAWTAPTIQLTTMLMVPMAWAHSSHTKPPVEAFLFPILLELPQRLPFGNPPRVPRLISSFPSRT